MSKNELFIPWHLEHVKKEHPQVAASWNMLSFECETGVGNTGFVSAIDLYNEMPVEWKSFLDVCEVMTEGKYILPRKCIQNHRIKDEKIIPKPKWQFVLKNAAMWFFGFFSLLFGSLYMMIKLAELTGHALGFF